MSQEDFYALHDEASRGSAPMAVTMVNQMKLPKSVQLKMEFSSLGPKLCNLALNLESDLEQIYPGDVPTIIAMAQYEYWFAASEAASYMKISISNGNMNNTPHVQAMATPQGYADSYGWATTLANGFAPINPSDERIALIRDNFNREILEQNTALKCMALLWLDTAVLLKDNNRIHDSLDLVFEANSALSSLLINNTWDDAFKEGKKEVYEIAEIKARSDLAKKASHASHNETRALKSEVELFWRANISRSITNDAAATILIKNFPLSFRKLSAYVSEFKNTPG